MEVIRKNDICFVGLPSCGYGYESAKSCFLACPSDTQYTLVIDTIKNIVESKHYECHIALETLAPGSYAFCTKICSKIIQSQFCIVLLDPSFYQTKKKDRYPNPNVHFEYGMILSQNKYVIPLQSEDEILPFNIAPLDTIKYNNSNLKIKVTKAIDLAIEKANSKSASRNASLPLEISMFYNINGFQLGDITGNKLFKYFFDIGNPLGFFFFNKTDGQEYKYVGIFDLEKPQKAIFHTKILFDNISSAYKWLISGISQGNRDGLFEKYQYSIKQISIDLIISSLYDKQEIDQKIRDLLGDTCPMSSVKVYHMTDISNYIKTQYEQIGELKIVKNRL